MSAGYLPRPAACLLAGALPALAVADPDPSGAATPG
jgi:hypothetical protein